MRAMRIEGALLTGGASRRMGAEKAQLLVDGEPVAERTARLLAEHCSQVTVLGRVPLPNCVFLEDQQEFTGPLVTLSYFRPAAEAVFIASCDMPRFDAEIVQLLHSLLGDRHAAIPRIGGRLQPLCALYSASIWAGMADAVEAGTRSMFGWIDTLNFRVVEEDDLRASDVDPLSLRGANTPEEWAQLRNGGS